MRARASGRRVPCVTPSCDARARADSPPLLDGVEFLGHRRDVVRIDSTFTNCVKLNYDLRASPLPFFSRRRFLTSSSKDDSPSSISNSEGRGASRQ